MPKGVDRNLGIGAVNAARGMRYRTISINQNVWASTLTAPTAEPVANGKSVGPNGDAAVM